MYKTNINSPKSEIDQRIDKLKVRLAENNIDAALLVQRADLFYFTGSIQEAHLYVPVDDEPILMVFKSLERALVASSRLGLPKRCRIFCANPDMPYRKSLEWSSMFYPQILLSGLVCKKIYV
jgi:Xaa-Pro aminopeptidase